MATTVGQISAVNPATEEVITSFDAFGRDEVEMALAETHDAFLEWRDRPIAELAVPMRALARLLRERSDRYARLATLEMGKPIVEARAEIEKCAFGAEHFAQNAARYLADEEIRANARRSIVAFQPLGVVLAVMPWNFPFWQVVRFAAPALESVHRPCGLGSRGRRVDRRPRAKSVHRPVCHRSAPLHRRRVRRSRLRATLHQGRRRAHRW